MRTEEETDNKMIDELYRNQSTLFKTHNGLNYYLLADSSGWCIWAIINGRRVLTPLYPPNAGLTPDQVWEGGHLNMNPCCKGQDPTYSPALSVPDAFHNEERRQHTEAQSLAATTSESQAKEEGSAQS